MICPKCNGKGFIELEHGIFTRSCRECKGTGEVIDSSNGTDTDNIITGSGDTSLAAIPQKQKARSKTRKKTR